MEVKMSRRHKKLAILNLILLLAAVIFPIGHGQLGDENRGEIPINPIIQDIRERKETGSWEAIDTGPWKAIVAGQIDGGAQFLRMSLCV